MVDTALWRAGPGRPPAALLLLLAAAALAAGAAARQVKPATPLVFGGAAAPESTADRMRFAEWSRRPAVLPTAPVVPRNKTEPLMPAVLPATDRECPPPPCPLNGTCPHRNGYCCSGSKHCCEEGWSCVRSDPPTCVKEESLLVWAQCVGRACRPGYKCPHEGVTECCTGGNQCCAKGYYCFGLDELTQKCVKMTKAQVAEMRREDAIGREEQRRKELADLVGAGEGLRPVTKA